MDQRVYRYRPHLRWFQYGLLLFYTLVFVLPAAVSAFRASEQGLDFMPYALTAFFFSALAMGLFFVFRTMSSTQVIVDADGIRYRHFRKDFKVPFDQIQGLKHPAIPYLGGWLKIRSDQPDIRLTVVLEGLDDLVRDLKEGLDRAGNSDVYNEDKLFSFFKTAAYATQSWDRIYSKAGLGCLIATVALFSTVSYCWATTSDITPGILLSGGLLIILPALGWLIAELIHLRLLARGADQATYTVPAPPAGIMGRTLLFTALGGLLTSGALYLLF